MLVRARGTHRVEITALPVAAEGPPDRPRKTGEPQCETLHFVASGEPGVYLLRAAYARPGAGRGRPRGGPGEWAADLLGTPAVRIEVAR